MGPYFDYAVLVCTGGTHFLNPRNPRVVPSIVQFYTIVGTHLSNTSQAFLYSSQSRCTAPTQAVLFLRSIGIFQGSSRSNKTLVLYCPSSIHITHSPYPSVSEDSKPLFTDLIYISSGKDRGSGGLHIKRTFSFLQRTLSIMNLFTQESHYSQLFSNYLIHFKLCTQVCEFIL